MSKGLLCLVLNIVLPGVGSLIGGKTTNGIIQLILTFTGIATIVAWIWALVDGIELNKTLTEKL